MWAIREYFALFFNSHNRRLWKCLITHLYCFLTILHHILVSTIPPQCFNPVLKVGDGYADHGFWGRPENMNMARPAYKVNTGCHGSDVAGDTAAAMASGYLVFKDICGGWYMTKSFLRFKYILFVKYILYLYSHISIKTQLSKYVLFVLMYHLYNFLYLKEHGVTFQR